jgi:basic membrane lipoprotein Med (substrate-binding protein (PBP1-ABC) superfamily)
MNVTILSRKHAEELIAEGRFPENTVVISFYDPSIKHIDKNYAHIDYSDVSDTVFYSELDDLDLDVLCDKGYTFDTYFSEADDMATFICNAYNSGKDIICQCEYGQSRSAGCAAAIRQHFYNDGIWVFADFKRYPNQLVFRKLFDALEKIDPR